MSVHPHIAFNDRRMYGGSFFKAPRSNDFLTINLMAEHPLPCDIHVPIVDYSIPKDPLDLVAAFDRILEDPRDVYVGCFGGIGRTGLFMSCFLKYLGHPQPLAHVRTHYNPHAVETPEQERFLADFHFIAPQMVSRLPRPR